MNSISKTDDNRFGLLHGGLFDSFFNWRGENEAKTNRRKVIVFIALTFIPMFLLCLVQNLALPPTVKVPLIFDIAEMTRFLIVGPFLILAEKLIEPWLVQVTECARNRIVAKTEIANFDKIIDTADRCRDSYLAELLIFLATFAWQAVDAHNQSSILLSSWQTIQNGTEPSFAWYFYAYFAKPFYRFLWLRWLWRYFIWSVILVKMSFLKLSIRPTHPDGLGGLEFIVVGHNKFNLLSFAFGMQAASILADQIVFGGRTLMSFRYDLVGFVLIVAVIFLSPLLVFTLKLAEAKRLAVFEYGALADDYVSRFHEKWVGAENRLSGEGEQQALLGSSDIQSLADLSNSFKVVREMKTCLVSKDNISAFVLATLIPFSPLLLTVYPFDELLNHLLKTLM